MAEPIDQAYVLAESAINENDDEHFEAILKEFPNLDTYNGPIRADRIRSSWRQPLLGIAIENENTQIVDIILDLENYKITKPLNYEDSESKITALAYAEKKRNQRRQESGGSNLRWINHIIKMLREKLQKQNGGKSRRNRRNRKSRSTTSRRRRH
jgi:hypothetical protein